MQFIREMVEYFAEILTEEQKKDIDALWEIRVDDEEYDEEYDETFEWEQDEGVPYPYDTYDVEYDAPRLAGKSAHSGGKRRPLRHPAVSAEKLVDSFRSLHRQNSVPLRLFSTLAGLQEQGDATGKKRTNWGRLVSAVESLKEFDVDQLTERFHQLFEKDRALSVCFFKSWLNGDLTAPAEKFCTQKVEGVAARAALAALRNTAYPEKKDFPEKTNEFRPFMENQNFKVIFSYFRVLRKLEYMLSEAAAEARKRVIAGYTARSGNI